MLYLHPRLGSLSRDLNLSSFRTGAIALTAAAAMFAGTSAYAGDFTQDECRLISSVGTGTARAIGPEKLSQEFKSSFRSFLGPNLTCDGPKDILTPTGIDIDTFNTIKDILYAPPRGISLEKAGLRSVDPKGRGAQRPIEQKRSDLNPALRANFKVD